MNILLALVLAFITFVVFNLFIEAGIAGLIAVVVFALVVFGNSRLGT